MDINSIFQKTDGERNITAMATNFAGSHRWRSTWRISAAWIFPSIRRMVTQRKFKESRIRRMELWRRLLQKEVRTEKRQLRLLLTMQFWFQSWNSESASVWRLLQRLIIRFDKHQDFNYVSSFTILVFTEVCLNYCNLVLTFNKIMLLLVNVTTVYIDTNWIPLKLLNKH